LTTEPGRCPGTGIARGAVVIAGFTVLSRLFGLIRTLVFAQTVGVSCVGSAYVTAYQVPNLVYELVLGGALTSAVIQVLAHPAARADTDPAAKARVSQITSALLTWSVVILVPLSAVIAAAAMPIAALLNPANGNTACDRADMVSATGHMLEAFAPQVALYGLSAVLFGLLQSYRRFIGPTLGPAISSVLVIAACLAFVPLDRGHPVSSLPPAAGLVLSAGTTLGIAALVMAGAVPAWRLRLRLRPVWRFPPGVARRTGGLALVGIVEIAASELSSVVCIELANGRGSTGSIVVFNYASEMFNSVIAVLAISVVISAFPALAAQDGADFDRTCAGSTRAVLLLSWLGTAMIAAVAMSAARVLAKQPGQVPQLIEAYALLAPGIAGTAVIANLSRAMLAIGRLRVAAVAVAGSWLLVIAADITLAELVPAGLVAPALALGNTLGQTAAAVPLALATRGIRGRAAVQGIGRAALAGLAAGTVSAAVGIAICLAVPAAGKLASVGVAVIAAVAVVVVFGAVGYALDPDDLRTPAGRLARIAGRQHSR
jgi:putative peptidoglycan lipid II flippase